MALRVKNRTLFTGDNLDVMRGMNCKCVDLRNDRPSSLGREAHPARNTIGLAPSGMKQPERKLREVEVPDPSYQPNAAELRQDLRQKGTFEEAIKALVAPVRIRRVMPRKSSR